jgi:uncharacterized HAD superfamily protein
MIIGIDVDDVLVEYVKSFLIFYNEKNKTNLSYKKFIDINNSVDKDNSFFCSSYFRDMKICFGAREVIKKLARDNELFIVTSRQIEWKEFTDNFIRKNFPDCFKEIFYASDIHGGEKKKSEIYAEMDIIIEDNKGHALDCARMGKKVFLIDKPWNQGIEHPNIIKVSQWKEILNLIEKIN